MDVACSDVAEEAPAATVGLRGAEASTATAALGCTLETGGASAGKLGGVRLVATVAVPTESGTGAEVSAGACAGAAAWRVRCAKAAAPMTSAKAANPPIA